MSDPRSDLWLVESIFTVIVVSLVGWNVYASTMARRRRRVALRNSRGFYDVGVCSSSAFTFNVLRQTLEGLPTSAGEAARITEYTPGVTYRAVLLDLEHPGDCALSGRLIGICLGSRQAPAPPGVEAVYRLPHSKENLTKDLGLVNDAGPGATFKPTAIGWIMLIVSIVFIAILVWTAR